MRWVLLLTAVVACACSSSATSGASDVRLAVEPDVTSPGDTVELTLSNDSAEAVGYNLCSSGLERASGGTWQPVPSDRVCTMELRTLEPGTEASFAMELQEGLAAGEYRFSTTVERLDAGTRDVVSSAPFEVGS